MADARFRDGDEGPLRLLAETPEDLPVFASLLQDAVLTGADLAWDRRRRRFALLINRFRWEDEASAESSGRRFERVRSLLAIEDVLAVRSQGPDPRNKDEIFSILDLQWQPGEDGTGRITLILAGDGMIELSVEALSLRLQDVTKPHYAVGGRKPSHD